MISHPLIVNRPADTSFTSERIWLQDYRDMARKCHVLLWAGMPPTPNPVDIWIVGGWESDNLTLFQYYRVEHVLNTSQWVDPATIDGAGSRWFYNTEVPALPWMMIQVASIGTDTNQRVWVTLIE